VHKQVEFAELSPRQQRYKSNTVLRRAVAIGLTIATLAAVQQAQASPDNALGTALLAARVGSGAALNDGAGATSVIHVDTGQYAVIFDRDVSGCFYSVTPVEIPRFFYALPYVGTTQGVFVEIMDSANHDADTGFFLTVFCNR
jgi:hypothetical protein